ncbi:DUF6263 family protein [Clostridium ganghwense]|uniref:DUF6263 family protein n=1 Tax=Clostridium ganghwense TaxID=312089 RepID=A0ABT4CM81_9CLOT|nr:DUF6263 family protein [Clostridium ganghwense]MCY6370164.1 DUF6263 family protein [Clostridium ganghwense]
MKKKVITLIVFILTSILLLTGCMEEKVKFSLKLKKGDSYRIETGIDQKVVQEINGKTIELNSKYNISYSCLVSDVDNNKNATVQVTFDTINMKNVVNNGQTLEYNSGDPTANMDNLNRVYSALLGKKFTVKISEDGKIKEITGIDEVIKSIITELDIENQKQRDEIQKVVMEQFGKDALGKKVQNITGAYPDEPVKVGDSWEKKIEISEEYPIEAESKYTLKERKDEISEVTVASKLKTKEDAKPLILANIKINYEFEGTQDGVITVDEETGITKYVEMNSKYSGTIKFTSDDPNIGAQTFPISVEAKTIITISKR